MADQTLTSQDATELKTCDLVMTGGITSGIVYPPAVIALKDLYSFRKIGGASAGAVGAAGVAAAEFNRRNGGGDAGFTALDESCKWLGESGNLLQLFQPSSTTQPLMDILMAFLGRGTQQSPGSTTIDILRKLLQTDKEESTGSPTADSLFTLLQRKSEQGTNSAESVKNDDKEIGGTDPFVVRLLLQWIHKFFPGLPQGILQFTRDLILTWSQRNRVFEQGARYGTFWGVIVGIVLAIILSFTLFGIASLFLPAGGPLKIFLLALLVILMLVLGLLCARIGWWIGGIGGALIDLTQVASRLSKIAIDLFTLVTSKMPEHFYGICPGHIEGKPNVLTDWLSDQFDKIAGLPDHKSVAEPPLTFEQLCQKKRDVDGKPQGITLKMVTTNLSHGRPYTLPSIDLGAPEDEQGISVFQYFLFNERDMYKLFPERIVKHMLQHSVSSISIQKVDSPQKAVEITSKQLPTGYHFMPLEKDLPVVFGVRLSLSYPFLISAVPLYTISASALDALESDPKKHLNEETDLQQNWFSDGGISSNFPIHFFDAWLPKVPTFGMTFTPLPNPISPAPKTTGQDIPSSLDGDVRVADQVGQSVNKGNFSAVNTNAIVSQSMSAGKANRHYTDPIYLPHADELQFPVYQDLKHITAFIGSIVGAAMSYHDVLQSQLPSYRERIVQIRLDDSQGGFNLNMSEETIKTVVNIGQQAGVTLCNPQEFSFEQHCWVRFRVLMAQLEDNLGKVEDVLNSSLVDYQALLDKESLSDPKFPYYRDKIWCGKAMKHLELLKKMLHDWRQEDQYLTEPPLFGHDAPLPKPTLRMTPEI